MGRKPSDSPPIPPYIPYKTFINFLDGLRITMPNRIDRSVMRSLSGAAQSALISTMKYMGLLNQDDTPSEQLARLANSTGVDREIVLRNILRSTYPSLFSNGFNLEKATAQQIREQFEGLGVSGDTVRKCIAFFISAAKDAKIELSPFIGNVQRGPRPLRQRTKRNDGVPTERDSSEIQDNPPAPELLNWNQLLLAKFPSFNPQWEPDVQAKWFDSFEKLMGRTERK